MGRRTGISSDETRQELLQATMKILLTHGYEGTRVSEIAKEAGVTSGAIYNHFSSKAELLSAAITQQAPDVISDLLDAGGDTSLIDAFREAAALLPESARLMGPLLLELVVSAGRDDAVAEVVVGEFTEQERTTADVIRAGQDRHEVDPILDADALSRLATTIALGTLVVAAVGLKPVDQRDWAAVIDRLLVAVQPGKDAV